MDPGEWARYWWHWGKQRSCISLISQHIMHTCLRLLLLEWRLQTITLVIQMWESAARAPRRWPKTENIRNSSLCKAHRDRKTKDRRRRGGGGERESWEEGDHDCVYMFMYSGYCFYPPTPPLQRERLFIWFVKATRSVMKHCHNNQRDASIRHLFSRSRLRWNGILIGVRIWW